MEIEHAKKDVNDMFKSLSPMITEIVSKYSKEMDKLIDKISTARYLSNEELRDLMLALSVESYMFGMSKDASLLKQECATTLMKEAMAQQYNISDGTQAVRNNASIINSSDKQVINLLYSAVANMMKTKMDEAHRMVNTLNSILISRNAEAKMAINKLDEESAKTRLLEDVH